MSKTRIETIHQILDRLDVLAWGQEASEQDVGKVDRVFDAAVSTLNALDIYYVSDPGTLGPDGGNIEDEIFLPLSDWVASYMRGADARQQALKAIAEADLIRIAASPRTRQTLEIDPALQGRRNGVYRGGF